MKAKRIASEVLLDLSSRMDQYPARSEERKKIVKSACELYGVSESTLYRQLRQSTNQSPLNERIRESHELSLFQRWKGTAKL